MSVATPAVPVTPAPTAASSGRAAALYTLPSVVSMALPFATLPVMTRWLTPADYGALALSQVVATAFMGFASLGLGLAVERSYFRYEHEPSRVAALMHTAIALVIVAALGVGALLFAVREPLAAALYGEPGWASLMLALSAGSVLNVLTSLQLGYLRNRGRAVTFVRLTLVSSLVEAGLAVVLVVAGLGVWGLAVAPIVVRGLFALGLWVRMAYELPPAFDAGLAREMLAIGLPLLPRTCFGVVENGIDRLLVSWLASLGEVGLLSMANRVGYSTFALMSSIENVYIPHVYREMFKGGSAGGAIVGRYLTPYFYASVLPAVLVVLFIEEALWVLVGPAFYGVKVIAAILTAYYGQMFFGKITGLQFVYLKLTWYSTPFGALRVVCHILFALLLIPRAGALGAALGLFFTGVIIDGVSCAVAQRKYRIGYELGTVVPVMLLLYASLAWVIAASSWGVSYPASLAVRIALAVAALAYGRRWWRDGARRVGPVWRRVRGGAA